VKGEKDSEADCYCVHDFILPKGSGRIEDYYCKCS